MLRHALIAASESERLRELARTMALARAVAMRFVAGETLDDALRVVGEIATSGRSATLDYLGEAVTDPSVARASADVYLEALDRIGSAGLPCGVSVKPTGLGFDGSPEGCEKLIAEIATRARDVGAQVTIDMEGSDYTQATVDLVASLQAAGHDNVGCAVQSYLHRTGDDVRRLTGLGASLRLCKGAYAEPDDIAYQDPVDIAVNYVRCAATALAGPTYGRFATHDHHIIARIRDLARRAGAGTDRYEFQMLHGVREPLQRELVAAGERVRVYVPFGDQWYPYFVRRMAERPANLGFFLRALVSRR